MVFILNGLFNFIVIYIILWYVYLNCLLIFIYCHLFCLLLCHYLFCSEITDIVLNTREGQTANITSSLQFSQTSEWEGYRCFFMIRPGHFHQGFFPHLLRCLINGSIFWHQISSTCTPCR